MPLFGTKIRGSGLKLSFLSGTNFKISQRKKSHLPYIFIILSSFLFVLVSMLFSSFSIESRLQPFRGTVSYFNPFLKTSEIKVKENSMKQWEGSMKMKMEVNKLKKLTFFSSIFVHAFVDMNNRGEGILGSREREESSDNQKYAYKSSASNLSRERSIRQMMKITWQSNFPLIGRNYESNERLETKREGFKSTALQMYSGNYIHQETSSYPISRRGFSSSSATSLSSSTSSSASSSLSSVPVSFSSSSSSLLLSHQSLSFPLVAGSDHYFLSGLNCKMPQGRRKENGVRLYPQHSESNDEYFGEEMKEFKKDHEDNAMKKNPSSKEEDEKQDSSTETISSENENIYEKLLIICGPSGVGKSTLIKRLMADYPSTFGFSISHTTRQPRPGEEDGVDYYYISKEEFEEAIGDKDDETLDREEDRRDSNMNDEMKNKKNYSNQKRKQNTFLEYAHVHGNLYGTSFQSILDLQLEKKIGILDIDVQGVKNVKKQLENYCNPKGSAKKNEEDKQKDDLISKIQTTVTKNYCERITISNIGSTKKSLSFSPIYLFVAPPHISQLEERLRNRNTEDTEALARRLGNAKKEIEYGYQDGNFNYILVNDEVEKSYKDLKNFIKTYYRTNIVN